MFIDSDFDKATTLFRAFMKTKIGMPKVGKNTLLYWTSRGWSEQESLVKKIKKKKNTPSPMSVLFWMNKGMSLEDAELKVQSQRKTNKEYWISRGFSLDESIQKVKDFQKLNSKKLLEKRQKDSDFDQRIRMNNPVSIHYWTEIGFTEEDAKLKVKERQATFSLEKCIQKYGKKNGTEIWQKKRHRNLEKKTNKMD